MFSTSKVKYTCKANSYLPVPRSLKKSKLHAYVIVSKNGKYTRKIWALNSETKK